MESKNNLNFRIIFICSTVWKSHCIKMSHSLCLDLLICPANVQFFVHTLHPYSWTVVPDHLNTAIQSNSLLWSNQLKIQIFTGVLSGERSINFRLGADAVVFKRLTPYRIPLVSSTSSLMNSKFYSSSCSTRFSHFSAPTMINWIKHFKLSSSLNIFVKPLFLLWEWEFEH